MLESQGIASQIEGTQSTLSDLLRYETDAFDGAPVEDVREVSNYVKAMMYGPDQLRENLPLCLRPVRDMHGILLASGRGAAQHPGEFRRIQNWIGGSRPSHALFIPPPPQEAAICLSELEKFLHEQDSGLPPLIKAGLIHVQFETIHPFLDGNGRIGRLLITLYLCSEGLLHQPLLYLSLYFKTHRKTYYQLLQEVRTHGAWERWMAFFLESVTFTANQAFETAGRIADLFRVDCERIVAQAERSGNLLLVHQQFQSHPYLTPTRIQEKTRLSMPTVNAALSSLEALGLMKEITERKRNRVYAYSRYLEILDEGTQPL